MPNNVTLSIVLVALMRCDPRTPHVAEIRVPEYLLFRACLSSLCQAAELSGDLMGSGHRCRVSASTRRLFDSDKAGGNCISSLHPVANGCTDMYLVTRHDHKMNDAWHIYCSWCIDAGVESDLYGCRSLCQATCKTRSDFEGTPYLISGDPGHDLIRVRRCGTLHPL